MKFELACKANPEFITQFSPLELQKLKSQWRYLCRPNQRICPPEMEPFDLHILLCGRFFGKSVAAINWIIEQAATKVGTYAIVARTAKEAKDINIRSRDTGIIPWYKRNGYPGKLIWDKRENTIEFPNGSLLFCYSAQEPDSIRGGNLTAALFDEIGSYPFPQESYEQLRFALRKGISKAVLITTPKPAANHFLKELIDRPTTLLTTGTSWDNEANITKEFRKYLEEKELTKIGKQEIYGIMIDDTGFLFKESWIRYKDIEIENLDRIVVAVDPAISMTTNSNESGIVIAGKCGDKAYVLEDASLKGSPNDVVQRAISNYHKYNADCIVVEGNQGGDWLLAAFESADHSVRVHKVTATRGKSLRADPIAALYERERIFHVRQFHELEQQMRDFDPVNHSKIQRQTGLSPDRLDALVWALTYLFERHGFAPRISNHLSFAAF